MDTKDVNPRKGYYYQKEGDRYIIYKDSNPHTTPQGTIVWASNEVMAQKVVEALKKAPNKYTSSKDFLCYHYSYCEMLRELTKESLVSSLTEFSTYDNLLEDPFLMLFQDVPIQQVVAVYYEKSFPEFYQRLPFNRLTAFQVILQCWGSIVLPRLMITDLVENGLTSDEDIESFLDEFEEYLKENDFKVNRSEDRKSLQMFIFYCTH